jgi:hypothetical protein
MPHPPDTAAPGVKSKRESSSHPDKRGEHGNQEIQIQKEVQSTKEIHGSHSDRKEREVTHNTTSHLDRDRQSRSAYRSVGVAAVQGRPNAPLTEHSLLGGKTCMTTSSYSTTSEIDPTSLCRKKPWHSCSQLIATHKQVNAVHLSNYWLIGQVCQGNT